MNLLVTGGSGFLGRRTSAYLQARGFRVLAPSHSSLDITEEASVRNWFQEQKPDVVIHTAAISDTGLCQRQPEWSETVNVGGCVNLAKACREFGSKLLLCSSDQVYSGSVLPGPHREAEPVTPNNVYGRQKHLAELKCLEIAPDTVCLRLSWMYSTESLPGEHGHFLTTLKAALEDEGLILTWPVYDRRGITNVDVVVGNLPAAWKLSGGIYNFGSENHANTFQTVQSVLENLNMAHVLARLKPNEAAFAENPRDISMDTAKIRAAGICFPSTVEGLIPALKKEETL